MIFTVKFVNDMDANSAKDAPGGINIEAEDLHAVVERARIVLSSRDFKPAVEGFRIIANGDQVVYQEHRGTSDILEPVCGTVKLTSAITR